MKNRKTDELIRKFPAELNLEDPAHYIQSIMEDCDACHLPVTTNGQLLGLVSRSETMVAAVSSGPGYLVARDFMKPHPISVRAGLHLLEVAFIMSARQLDCLPVVGEREQLLGMVHIHDVVSAFLAGFAGKEDDRAKLALAA